MGVPVGIAEQPVFHVNGPMHTTHFVDRRLIDNRHCGQWTRKTLRSMNA
jgi:hypothetical protein